MRNIKFVLIIAAVSAGIICVSLAVFIFNNLSAVSKKSEESLPAGNTLHIEPSILNGSINIPLDSPLNIKILSKKPNSKINIIIQPQIQYSVSISNSSLDVIHENFAPGTTYTFLISEEYQNKTFDYSTFSFTTLGTSQHAINTNESAYIAKKSDQFLLQNHPDIFLLNNTPYNSSDFSIKQKQSTDKIEFVVTVKTNKASAKNAFFVWARGLGLTDEMLEKISISYE